MCYCINPGDIAEKSANCDMCNKPVYPRTPSSLHLYNIFFYSGGCQPEAILTEACYLSLWVDIFVYYVGSHPEAILTVTFYLTLGRYFLLLWWMSA